MGTSVLNDTRLKLGDLPCVSQITDVWKSSSNSYSLVVFTDIFRYASEYSIFRNGKCGGFTDPYHPICSPCVLVVFDYNILEKE